MVKYSVIRLDGIIQIVRSITRHALVRVTLKLCTKVKKHRVRTTFFNTLLVHIRVFLRPLDDGFPIISMDAAMVVAGCGLTGRCMAMVATYIRCTCCRAKCKTCLIVSSAFVTILLDTVDGDCILYIKGKCPCCIVGNVSCSHGRLCGFV